MAYATNIKSISPDIHSVDSIGFSYIKDLYIPIKFLNTSLLSPYPSSMKFHMQRSSSVPDPHLTF